MGVFYKGNNLTDGKDVKFTVKVIDQKKYLVNVKTGERHIIIDLT